MGKVDRHRTQKQHVFLGVTTTLRKEAVKPEFDINMATTEGNLYLGFDFSTQQIKAVIIDEALKVIAEEHVNFDQDLKEYRTSHGFHEGHNGKVTAPTIMWVKALDLIMERIRIQGVDLSRVAA